MSHEAVEAVVEKYKNRGEEGAVRATPIDYQGVVYFYAIYLKHKKPVGSIIVTVDGVVPPLDKIRDVLWIAVGVYAAAKI